MDLLLRRQGWATNLIGIALGTAMAGHAAASLIGAALPSRPAAGPPRRDVTPPVVVPTDKTTDAIIGRDVFCSTRGEAPVVETGRRALTLLAIMLAPADPRWSLAIIRDDDAATVGPYGVGAHLGDATIEAIEGVRVVLDVGQGRRELLELLAPRGRSSAVVGLAEPFAQGIKKTGPNGYELRRAVIDRILAGGLTGLPRVVPHVQDGQPVGLRLRGVGHSGPFGAIGLRDGDVLLQVNDRSLATPDAALAAYGALRTESHVWLAIERDGRQLRLDYLIR